MFTGLIEEIGEIIAVEPIGDSIRLTIAGPLVTSDAEHGASICVSGVCLTVVEQGRADADPGSGRGWFAADVMQQSIRMSTLGELRPGSPVNLERAVRADTRLGGHIVQGHVDGTATLLSTTEHPAWRTLRFSLSPELAPLLVDKGSVTLSGVSLTVSAISDPPSAGVPADAQWFEVSLIPETLTATTLGSLEAGDRVNVETDILARHLARMHSFFTTTGGTPA
ncbi:MULTISPECIES: riboflavin synthase [unclassified Leucobacter]|uniref:riboflavin synthase n=1 Tax=unclassified Leucobacter TaxID=2621730 RepID=UPI003015D190